MRTIITAVALILSAGAAGAQVGTGGVFGKTPTVPGIKAGKPALMEPTCPSNRVLMFFTDGRTYRCGANVTLAPVAVGVGNLSMRACAPPATLGYAPDGQAMCASDFIDAVLK